jgi:DNA (cytosine-5)-methyltransferase 1
MINSIPDIIESIYLISTKSLMRSIELFSGVGGLGIGLHQAGFQPVQVIEWDHYCCSTIRNNQSEGVSYVNTWPLFEADIRTIDFGSFAGKIALVSGGPPCQPFSLGGKHKAYEDDRDMFSEAVRVVRETHPKAFIFENVKGLTRSTFKNYFEYIRLQLENPFLTGQKGENWPDHFKRLERHHTSGVKADLHYNVVSRVVNAANYGIPQKRERVFFVGFRNDLGIEWNFPEETHSLEALVWSQVNGDYWDRHGIPKKNRPFQSPFKNRSTLFDQKQSSLPWITVRDALRGLPDPANTQLYDTTHANHKFQPGAKRYPGHTGSTLDQPAKTLKAGVHGVPGGENMIAYSDGSVRYFSVRESARLQTFPDDYLFNGSWTESMRQIGNAVPVKLARIMGSNIIKHLEKLND